MEVIFAGFGGQGVLTSGLITAFIAMKTGNEVLWSPGYSVEQRGGKAHSLVKFDKEEITEPIVTELDVLVAMNQPALDYCSDLKKGGLLIINADAVEPDAEIPAEFKTIWIPVNTLANEVKNPKGANLVTIGVLVKETGAFELNEAEETLCQFFVDKGKGAFNEANLAAFRAGYYFQKGDN